MRKRIRSGVYQIINEVNGKSYVGSSQNIDYRWSRHRNSFKKPMKNRSILWDAAQKHGVENFTFIVLEECDVVKEMLLAREQHYIDTLNPEYNIMQTAGSRLGSKSSPETLEKLSKISKDRWAAMTSDARETFCLTRGYVPDDDEIKRRSDFKKSQWDDEQKRAQMCVNMSIASLSKSTAEERETRARVGGLAAWKDREKMEKAMATREWSPEDVQKRVAASKQYFIDNKEAVSAKRKALWDNPEFRAKCTRKSKVQV